jgi:site-specific DNA-methyltransferase (adenine-specific)
VTPYYQHKGIVILLGDCREVIPSLPHFDAVIADPPYGETSLEWDNQVRGWMAAAARVTSTIWCFGSLQMFMDMTAFGEMAGWIRAQELIWEKHNGSSFHADRFKRVHELIVQFYQGPWADLFKAPVTTPDATARAVRRKARPTHTGHIDASSYLSFDGGPRLMRSVIYAKSCHGSAVHPTQKPVEIIDPLLRYSVPPRGTVCDCFMGSGSTLVAAKRLGLIATGIDIDEQCCETAAKRLQQEVLAFQEATA